MRNDIQTKQNNYKRPSKLETFTKMENEQTPSIGGLNKQDLRVGQLSLPFDNTTLQDLPVLSS